MVSGGESDMYDEVEKDTQTEVFNSLWQARKAGKSAVTTKYNEIIQAMCCFELEDLKLVQDKEQKLILTMHH